MSGGRADPLQGESCSCERGPGPEELFTRVRPRLGLSVGNLVLGAFVAALVFSVLVAVETWWLNRGLSEPDPLSDLALMSVVLLHAFVPVMLVGLSVGTLLALAMRRVAHQAWHLLGFGLAGAAILGVPMLLGGQGPWGPLSLSVTAAAIAGRAVLWRRFVPPPRAR